MTRIYTPLITAQMDNSKIVQLHDPFGFNSDVMKKYGLKWHWRPPEPWNSLFPEQDGDVWFPFGFVFDFESIPTLLRAPTGENKRGGTVHDGACRKGVTGPEQASVLVCPGMTQSIAAEMYFEMMEYTDSIDIERFKSSNHPLMPKFAIVPAVTFGNWIRRHVKSKFVWLWPGGFFQKYDLDATCMQVAGIECDPYVTMTKANATIIRTEVDAGMDLGMTGATPDILGGN